MEIFPVERSKTSYNFFNVRHGVLFVKPYVCLIYLRNCVHYVLISLRQITKFVWKTVCKTNVMIECQSLLCCFCSVATKFQIVYPLCVVLITTPILHTTSDVFFNGSLVQLNKNATVKVVCHVRCIILCTFVIFTTYKTNRSMNTIRGTG